MRQQQRSDHAEPLSYETPAEPRQSRAERTAIDAGIGAAIGLAVALFSKVLLSSEGPIFPLTVVFAPLAVLWELGRPTNTAFDLTLFGGGAALFAAYGAAGSWWGRRAVIAVSAFHCACFVAVCWLRGVI